MTLEAEVVRYVKDPNLLAELLRKVIERLEDGAEIGETSTMEAQLREIAKAIDKLDQQGVPVPEVFRAEKTRLAAALGIGAAKTQALIRLTEELEGLLKGLNSRINHVSGTTPSKKPRNKRSPSPKTDRAVWRHLIIEALRQLGGSARKNDLYNNIKKNHEKHFLPGDFNLLPDGKRIAWKNYCDWEGTLLRKEGLLKSDSPRGLWELSEDHQ